MFATVRYGANCQVMVNLQCRVLILIAHLKRKCQCRPEDNIDLLDESGALMNLSKVENPASEFASKYLRERQRYILIRVIHLLQKLSANPQLRDQWRRGPMQRRAQSLASTPARPRPTPQSKKSSELKGTPR
ncbi:uncharacterized protein C22orf15 homolog isoform X2 [Apteryx mantelli]|uniref:Uncharacterized protein C22orf15 homolog isoform X2 n=1 Tax=Apteryx mantelli TaxID=2696672 RepID=A0A8B7IPK8_9AVES|nr:PREDICTED: uncharacterized protein C22orf15 homolog isoform X2 [Apteryx mantelli mantelli]